MYFNVKEIRDHYYTYDKQDCDMMIRVVALLVSLLMDDRVDNSVG